MRARAAVEKLFDGDLLDLERWAAILDTNVHLRLGARPAQIGLERALAELDLLLQHVAAFGDGFRQIWPLADSAWVETDVVSASRPSVIVPVALAFRSGRWPLVLDVRIYIDTAPLDFDWR